MNTPIARPACRDIILSDEEIRALGNGYPVVRDAVLGPPGAGQIVAALPRYADDLQPAAMGRGVTRWREVTERGDEITWIEPDTAPPALRLLWDLLEHLRHHLNQCAYLGLRRFDLQLAQYRQPGARYARHADAFRVRARRRVTAIYYANPDWCPAHGGVLRLYPPTGVHDVPPVLDRMVLFLSELVEHEVLPSFALRTAITAWFYGNDPE